MGATLANVRPPIRQRTWAVVRITRAENCLMAGVATLVGAAQAVPVSPARPAAAIVGSVLAVMLVLAFGNVVNDLVDVESDRTGKGNRPLPSASLSVPQARRLAATLAVAAVGVTLVTPHSQLPFVLAMCVVALIYTPVLKAVPLLGNAVFASQCGATIVFGANAAGGAGRSAVAAGILVAVGILCVEVAKTVEDYDADARMGMCSIAHLVPKSHHRMLVGVFAGAYVAVVVTLWGTARSPDRLALAVVPIIPLLAFALTAARGQDPAGRVPRFVVASKVLWLLALLALTGL